MKFGIWVVIFVGVFIWSAVNPYDYLTWGLEVLPAVILAVGLWYFHQRYQVTPMLSVLILLHCIILIIGGHYTYALVPGFEHFLSQVWPERNNYDKLGHFAQGFVPAIICREMVIRLDVFNSVAWQRFFVISFCLGFSAFYELIEWWVALLSGEGAESFLGTQGYVWDTQSDMFLALIGSIMALVILSIWHDKQIKQVNQNKQI